MTSPSEPFNPLMKRCTRCERVKPIQEFVIRASSSTGHGSWCKICHNAHTVETWRRGRKALIALQAIQRKGVKEKMATRQYEIEGVRWTPLQDIAKETGRNVTTVTAKAQSLGVSTKLIQPAPFTRKLSMIKSEETAKLIAALAEAPRYNKRGHGRRRVTNGAPAPAAPNPAPATAESVDTAAFLVTLRKLKQQADALDIDLASMDFSSGEASFERTKREVVKL
jgi:hypothetical protein